MQGRDTRIMALQRIFVGIDVSKDWLDLWLEPPKRFERVSNDAAGWAAILGLLNALGAAAGLVVAFEATGGYERGLRQVLLEAGFEVRRLNPLRVGSMPKASAATPRTTGSMRASLPATPRPPI